MSCQTRNKHKNVAFTAKRDRSDAVNCRWNWLCEQNDAHDVFARYTINTHTHTHPQCAQRDFACTHFIDRMFAIRTKVTPSTRIHSIICCVHYNVCTKLSSMPHAHKTLNYLDELALECYSSIWFLFTSILWSNFR